MGPADCIYYTAQTQQGQPAGGAFTPDSTAPTTMDNDGKLLIKELHLLIKHALL